MGISVVTWNLLIAFAEIKLPSLVRRGKKKNVQERLSTWRELPSLINFSHPASPILLPVRWWDGEICFFFFLAYVLCKWSFVILVSFMALHSDGTAWLVILFSKVTREFFWTVSATPYLTIPKIEVYRATCKWRPLLGPLHCYLTQRQHVRHEKETKATRTIKNH